MKTALLVEAAARRLYHATWPSRMAAILREGIKPSAGEGVYLAGKPGHAAGFVRLRGVEWLEGTDTVEIGGKSHVVPKIQQHDKIIVFEIDANMLDDDRLEESTDHSVGSGMYPADLQSYVYDGAIPASAITSVLEVDMN